VYQAIAPPRLALRLSQAKCCTVGQWSRGAAAASQIVASRGKIRELVWKEAIAGCV
jgi:hypothetical protein